TRAHLAALAITIAGLAGPARADYRSTVLSQGPVGFWALDETTQPPVLPIAAANAGSLGTAANGTISDGTVRGEPGIVGKSYRFSNPGWVVTYFGSHVDVPVNPALNPDGPFTVEFWAKPSSMPPDLFSPVCSLDASLNGGSSRSGYILYADGAAGRWQFRTGGTAGYASTSSGGTLDTNGWQHVVGVYTGTNTILYVNGAQVATAAASGFAPNTNQPFRLGATTIPNRTFDGWVDEVAFYGAALDATTIKAHYDAATTNSAGYSTQILANSPVGYWRLEEQGDPVAANLGTLGAAANGSYIYKATPGVGGPVPPGYPGFDAANKSVAFDGTGGYVTIPALNLNTNTVTITGWINATNSQKSGTVLIFSRSGTTIAGLTIDPNFDGLGLGYNWGGDLATTAWSPTTDSGLPTLPDSKWAFVALVVQPSQAAIYIGPGTDASTFVGATNLAAHAPQAFEGPTLLGADLTGTPLYLNGAMDEVAIFNRSLGEGEVFSQYAAAVGGVGPVIFADPQAPVDTVYEGDRL
ncbi:MAG: LamG domain-containing protein, partial [Limisphaerales bacterium]